MLETLDPSEIIQVMAIAKQNLKIGLCFTCNIFAIIYFLYHGPDDFFFLSEN